MFSMPWTKTPIRGLVMLALATVLACAGAARGETLTLQQGASGYSGCTSLTLWSPEVKDAKPAGQADPVLHVRGARNRLLLKFDLPAELKGKTLAEARLEVFVPEGKSVRMICEIMAQEVLQPWTNDADWKNAASGKPWTTAGGIVDADTDYDTGRPKGVADSFSIWEVSGQFFPHRYTHLAVPEGGKWIDFNVTPLVRKWLADAKANNGLALTPANLGDKRFLNPAVLEIPSAAHADQARRPRLVLELAPLAKPYLVGGTHTLERICDRDTRFRYFGEFTGRHELEMARNEVEGFQLVVRPKGQALKDVVLEWDDLAGADGAKIAKSDIVYYNPHVFALHANSKVKDWYFHGKNFELPDPLDVARPVDCPEGMTTAFWVNVRTRPETKPGLYQGKFKVKPGNAAAQELALTVRVWNYTVPEKWNFQTMGQTCWNYIWECYPKASKEKRAEIQRKYIDFLLDHRFNPTEQYAGNLSPSLGDIGYCVGERGGNTIYLSGAFKLPDRPTENHPEARKLTDRFAAAREELLAKAGKADELKKLKGSLEAAKAEASKLPDKAARAQQAQQAQEQFQAGLAELVRATDQAEAAAALQAQFDKDKAALMARLLEQFKAQTAATLKGLRERVDAVNDLDRKLREQGKLSRQERLMDMALVYIGDETSDWTEMRRRSDSIRLSCPELMIMIGGSFPRRELNGLIDIFDPQIDLKSNSVYSLPADQMAPLVAKSQAAGEKFFWYVAAGPMLPCPNVQLEDPLIASRGLFWMTWKFGVTGFEYYCYNIWSYNKPGKLSPRAFKGEYNGDGNLFYSGEDGPLSSVRFENIRDGIEDWESHYVLRDMVEALESKLKGRSMGPEAVALRDKSKALLKVPDEVCELNFAKWTWEPAVLLKARHNLGECLDAMSKLVSEEEIMAVRLARHKMELERQRAMLKQRADAAKAAAATQKAD